MRGDMAGTFNPPLIMSGWRGLVKCGPWLRCEVCHRVGWHTHREWWLPCLWHAVDTTDTCKRKSMAESIRVALSADEPSPQGPLKPILAPWTRDRAEFATKIKQEAPAGSVITTEEVGPARPYTVFEIAAGSGL